MTVAMETEVGGSGRLATKRGDSGEAAAVVGCVKRRRWNGVDHGRAGDRRSPQGDASSTADATANLMNDTEW